MRLACQERLLPGETLAERWNNARRAGYDGIELHGLQPADRPQDAGL